MFEKAKSGRDAFTFSLGGIRTIASFVAAPALDCNRLNEVLNERLSQDHEVQPDTAEEPAAIKGRFWLLRLRQAV